MRPRPRPAIVLTNPSNTPPRHADRLGELRVSTWADRGTLPPWITHPPVTQPPVIPRAGAIRADRCSGGVWTASFWPTQSRRCLGDRVPRPHAAHASSREIVAALTL